MNVKLVNAVIAINLTLCCFCQTFIGEIKTLGEHEYMKLEVRNDSTYLSFPYKYVQVYKYTGAPKVQKSIKVMNGIEVQEFEFKEVNNNSIQLETENRGTTQTIDLIRQQKPLKETALNSYLGNFIDENGNRLIVYNSRGHLRMMTPYEEQSVSLNPTGENRFWSTSGETTTFSNKTTEGFKVLQVKNRDGYELLLKRSFDYDVKEDWLMVNDDSIYFKLFIPKLEGKKPACLLLPGGGGRSQIDNFTYEARFFASHGIVSMIFDKASVGRSTGRSFENYSFKEKAKRYEQLFRYLQSIEGVDSQRVGIHGPSEGGRLALMMGINLGKEVAFINATATPIMTMLEGQLFATDHYSRRLGMTEEDIVTTRLVWKNYYQGILNESIDSSEFEKIKALRRKYSNAFLPPTSISIPLSPKKQDLTDSSVVAEAAKIKCPVFLQYGENDQRVNPYASINNFRRNTESNKSVEIKLYKRGNHSMMTPEHLICPGYAYDKIKWLKHIEILK